MNTTKKNILVVDDLQQNLQVIGNILKDNGLNVSFARDGKQALKGISKKLPDLILLDISMPDMNGFDVCTQLKADVVTGEIPVIFLTARIETEDIVKGFKLGAVDYVTKPFNSEELLARVFTHLELKEARDRIRRQNDELKIKNDELYLMSVTDKLTEISNRLYIMDVLTKEYAKGKRHSSDLACILFDIDHFKKFNDTHGHLFGDFVLKETAQLVKETLRIEDYFGRYGGEEFLIILPGISIEEAVTVAEKVRQAVASSQYTSGDIVASVTISLGISDIKTCQPQSEKEMIEFADKALYEAKSRGRNQSVKCGG